VLYSKLTRKRNKIIMIQESSGIESVAPVSYNHAKAANNAGHIMMVTKIESNKIYASAHTDDVVDQRILNSAGRVWYHVNNTTGGIQ